MIADIAQDANAAATTVKLSHLIDVGVGKHLRFWAAGKPIPGNPFTVNSYVPTLNTVTLDKPLGFALKATRDYAVIEARSPKAMLVFTAAAIDGSGNTTKAFGKWGDNLSVRVAPMVGNTFNILADPVTGGQPFTTTLSQDEQPPAAPAGGPAATAGLAAPAGGPGAPARRTAPAGPAAPAGTAQQTIHVSDDSTGHLAAGKDYVLIAGQKYLVSNVTPTTIAISPGLSATLQAGTSVTRMRPANAVGAMSLHVSGASQIYNGAILQLDGGTKETAIVDSISGRPADQQGRRYLAGHTRLWSSFYDPLVGERSSASNHAIASGYKQAISTIWNRIRAQCQSAARTLNVDWTRAFSVGHSLTG